MSDIFAKASRKKLRFPSMAGFLSVEDLWDLPLIDKASVSLDDVARSVNRDLKDSEEESFVEAHTAQNSDLSLRLDIVKRIIEVKLADRSRAEKSAETKAKKQQILELLQNKENASLAEKTPEELRELLDSL